MSGGHAPCVLPWRSPWLPLPRRSPAVPGSDEAHSSAIGIANQRGAQTCRHGSTCRHPAIGAAGDHRRGDQAAEELTRSSGRRRADPRRCAARGQRRDGARTLLRHPRRADVPPEQPDRAGRDRHALPGAAGARRDHGLDRSRGAAAQGGGTPALDAAAEELLPASDLRPAEDASCRRLQASWPRSWQRPPRRRR